MSAAVLCGPVFVNPHVREKQLDAVACTTSLNVNDNDLSGHFMAILHDFVSGSTPFKKPYVRLIRIISLAVIVAAFPVAVWAKARKSHAFHGVGMGHDLQVSYK